MSLPFFRVCVCARARLQWCHCSGRQQSRKGDDVCTVKRRQVHALCETAGMESAEPREPYAVSHTELNCHRCGNGQLSTVNTQTHTHIKKNPHTGWGGEWEDHDSGCTVHLCQILRCPAHSSKSNKCAKWGRTGVYWFYFHVRSWRPSTLLWVSLSFPLKHYLHAGLKRSCKSNRIWEHRSTADQELLLKYQTSSTSEDTYKHLILFFWNHHLRLLSAEGCFWSLVGKHTPLAPHQAAIVLSLFPDSTLLILPFSLLLCHGCTNLLFGRMQNGALAPDNNVLTQCMQQLLSVLLVRPQSSVYLWCSARDGPRISVSWFYSQKKGYRSLAHAV